MAHAMQAGVTNFKLESIKYGGAFWSLLGFKVNPASLESIHQILEHHALKPAFDIFHDAWQTHGTSCLWHIRDQFWHHADLRPIAQIIFKQHHLASFNTEDSASMARFKNAAHQYVPTLAHQLP